MSVAFQEASIRGCVCNRSMQVMSDQTEAHFVDVEGVRLHWAELGAQTRNEVPLVLLHGLNNSHLTWSAVAPLLAYGRRVLMPDLPGHGHSGRPNVEYELAWYMRHHRALARSPRNRKADIVGHSFGGGVAQMLLLERPKRCAAGPRRVRGPRQRRRLVASSSFAASVVEYFGQPFMGLGTRLVMRGLIRSEPKDVDELSRFNSRSGSARAFARSVRDVINLRGQRRNFMSRVNEVRASCGPLAMGRSRRTHSDRARPAFARLAEGAVFKTFVGCGHYLHNERPAAFAAVLGEFIDAAALPAARLLTPGHATSHIAAEADREIEHRPRSRTAT